MNIIVYCRVSSRDQVDGTSLDSQQAACRQFAAHKGWNISEVFIEQGESAQFADRTKLLELLNYCKSKEHRVEALLVWKLDRFARNIEDHYMIKATLRRMGVRVVSVTEPVDNDPNGKLMEAILAGFAQFDNDIRAVRTRQGMSQRVKDGIWPWRPPLGYLSPKMGKKREPDRPDPDTFDLLKKGWQLLATGAYSKAAILRLLRTWGLRGQSGDPISAQTLDRAIANPYYAGILRDPSTGDEYSGRHVPMVTVEEFARVQQITRRRSRSVPHHKIHEDFPVRGLVRCAACSWLLTAGWTQGSHGRYAYYSCSQRRCLRRRKSLPAGLIHDEFEALLANLSIPTGVAAAVIDALHDASQVQGGLLRAAAAKCRERIRQAQKQIQELIAMRTSRLLSDEEFVIQRDILRSRLVDFQSDSSGVSIPLLTRPEASSFVEALGDFPRLWKRLPAIQRHAFGQLLFPAGYVFQRIRTAERGLVFRILEGSSGASSHLVASVKANPNAVLTQIRRFLAIVGGVALPKEEAA